MDEFLNSMSNEILIILGINFLILLILFIMNIITNRKYKKLNTKYKKFMNGLSDRNIEELLDEIINRLNSIKDKNVFIENDLKRLDNKLNNCIQKVGVVRYNAFENVGSDLSYSVAFMDDKDNGVVFSSIFSRDSTTTYAKPISNGNSKHVLSAEEIKAIDMAKKSS